jgi:hypothetical protein
MEIQLCSVCNKNPISYKKTRHCSTCHKKYLEAKADRCISCKKRPVQIKKRMLCIPCYQREYRNTKRTFIVEKVEKIKCNITIDKYQNYNEIIFVQNYFTHKNWSFHPATFHMGGAKYSPDFYDAERNCFIEVVGTRQAYHLNKEKYELFKQTFPGLNFEIRTSDGRIVNEDVDRIEWKITPFVQEADRVG